MDSFLSEATVVKKMVFAGHIRARTSITICRARPSHGLVINCAGEKIYHFDNGVDFSLKTDGILYLPKGSNYTVDAIVPGDCYAINFTLEDDTLYPPRLFRIRNAGAYVHTFADVARSFRTQVPGCTHRCYSGLYDVFAMLLIDDAREYASPDSLRRLQPAMKLIAEQYTDPELSLPALAAACGISEVYLRRLFRRAYGTSPIDYICRLRLEHAKKILTAGMCSVAEAAEMAGFSDVSYFSRRFHAYTGLSPRAFSLSQNN